MGGVLPSRHLEQQVLQRSGLRHLPVDTGGCQRLAAVVRLHRHLPEVEDEIADVAEELVLIDVPLLAVSIGTQSMFKFLLQDFILYQNPTPEFYTRHTNYGAVARVSDELRIVEPRTVLEMYLLSR